MKLKGNKIISIDDCDIYYSYYDCWKSTNKRRNAVFQGIVEVVGGQMENAIKHRINAGDEESDANDGQWHQSLVINFALHWTLKFSNPAFLFISMV